jgi:hypothetical protein
VRLGLGEKAGKAAEKLLECRNGGVIEGHAVLFQRFLLSFRGDAKHRTRNLEIPGSLALLAPRNDGESVAPKWGLAE